MEFFDSITKSGQDVAQKARELKEVAKLKLAINEDEKRLNELFINMGKLYYEQFKEDAALAEPFSSMVKAVSTCLTKKTEKQTRVHFLQNTVPCPQCGAECSLNSLFCTSCGAGIEEAAKLIKKPFCCPNCGKKIEDDAIFCTGCGTMLK